MTFKHIWPDAAGKDLARCDICDQWAVNLKDIQESLIPFTRKAYTVYLEANHRPSRYCEKCEEETGNTKNVWDRRQGAIRNGHLFWSRKSTSRPGKWVYVYQAVSEIYKIGATNGDPIKRIRQQGARAGDLVCTIKSSRAFDLEDCLHNHLRHKKVWGVKSKEMFRLSRDDIQFIMRLKTLDGEPVEVSIGTAGEFFDLPGPVRSEGPTAVSWQTAVANGTYDEWLAEKRASVWGQ